MSADICGEAGCERSFPQLCASKGGPGVCSVRDPVDAEFTIPGVTHHPHVSHLTLPPVSTYFILIFHPLCFVLFCFVEQMTAEEFWNKYVRAEYLFHTKNSLAAAAEAADDEYLALFVDEDKELNQENQRKVPINTPNSAILSYNLWSVRADSFAQCAPFPEDSERLPVMWT